MAIPDARFGVRRDRTRLTDRLADTIPGLTGHSRVVVSARSLTHLRVRSLTCSTPPWTDLAMPGIEPVADLAGHSRVGRSARSLMHFECARSRAPCRLGLASPCRRSETVVDLAGHSGVGRSARSLMHFECARSRRNGRGLVLVGAEDVRRRAGVADRRGRIEVTQRDRVFAIREEAFHVVDPLGAGLDVDHPPKRAALDAVRRQLIGVGLRRNDGERQRHGGGPGPLRGVDPTVRSTQAPETSTARCATARCERY